MTSRSNPQKGDTKNQEFLHGRLSNHAKGYPIGRDAGDLQIK